MLYTMYSVASLFCKKFKFLKYSMQGEIIIVQYGAKELCYSYELSLSFIMKNLQTYKAVFVCFD